MARDERETARKLYRLMQSPNPHEAALARARYEEYTQRHQVTGDDEWDGSQAGFLEVVRRAQEASAALLAQLAAAGRVAQESEAKAEQSEFEYLRRLPDAKQNEYLLRFSPAKRVEYRRRLDAARQTARAKRSRRIPRDP